MDHVSIHNPRQRCLICGEYYTVKTPGGCSGPRDFGAPNEIKRQAFAEKIKTLSIHPKGRT